MLDAYLGSREVLQKKLLFLSNMAQEEKWDYKGTSDKSKLSNVKGRIYYITSEKRRNTFGLPTHSVFFDEAGKRARTKNEITGENEKFEKTAL